mgnify:CR=1|tara:strand:+ start:521 stop:691 length:171 start_codon:yes stop_codon:yes gene_type:complete
MQNVYEQIFFLKQDGNWNFSEVYNLPVKLREWFVNRLSRHFDEKAEAYKKASQRRK